MRVPRTHRKQKGAAACVLCLMFIACRLRSKHLPTPVRMQLTAFYDKRISAQEETNMVVDEFAILQELQPAPISVDIVQVLYSDTISRVPIFKSMEEDVSHTLAEHTTTHTHTRTQDGSHTLSKHKARARRCIQAHACDSS